MSVTTISAGINRDHYRVVLQAGKNIIIADEPEANGGGDVGMNPHEILASALGACTCATVRMYADRKGMNLDGLDVIVTLLRDEEKKETNMTRAITLHGNLTTEERDRLVEIANKCPVHKTLSNPIHIETTLSA